MRRMNAIVIGLGLAVTGCGKKKDNPAAGSASAGSAGSAAKVTDTVTCPPGNVVKDGACVAIITPDKVAAVAQQQTRLDELAKTLDKVDSLAAPVELLNGFFQLEEWKKFAATNSQVAALDKVVAVLAEAVKQLRAFKGGLGESAARLGNLKGELDRMLSDPNTQKQLAEARAQVSAQVKTAIEPLLTQTLDAIQKGIQPFQAKLEETSELIIGACVLAKQGGNDKVKDFCGNAKKLFGEATLFLADLEKKPAQLFDDVSKQITTQLEALIDDQTKALVANAQAKVNEVLKLPPGGAAPGSAAGSAAAGSGATK